LVDAKDVISSAYKVVVARGNVYLMGRVTEREANRGADLARSIGGVQKVVKVFEILSEQELAALGRQTRAAPVSDAASQPTSTPAPQPAEQQPEAAQPNPVRN
ncbi:MAG TPA: BON domain-containing protein, partial [Methylibium sp.]